MAEAPHDALFERVEEALDAQQKAQVAALESAVPTLAEHLRAACENALRQDMGKAFMLGSGNEAVREALAALRAQLDEPAVDTEALHALEAQVAALQEEKARIAEQHAHAQRELETALNALEAKAEAHDALAARLQELEGTRESQSGEMRAARARTQELERFIQEQASDYEAKLKEAGAARDAAEQALATAEAAREAALAHARALENTAQSAAQRMQTAEDAVQRLTQESEQAAQKVRDAEAGQSAAQAAVAEATRAAEARAAAAEEKLAEAEAQAAHLMRERDARVPAEQIEELRSLLHGERERANTVEAQLKEERGRGTKAVLAEQLAETLRELEVTKNALLHAEREAEHLRASLPQTDSAAPEGPIKLRGPVGKRTLGEILVDAGLTTREQLEQALEAQRQRPNHHLGGLLIELGYASEEAVAQALALQTNVPFLHLSDQSIEPDALRMVSERLATQHVCLPLRRDGDTLHVAMVNPLDLVAIEDLERATGLRIEVCVAPAAEIRAAVPQHYAALPTA